MIKIFRKIHLWLSVPFGIIITLICFSGAMLIFEPEITQAIKSGVYRVADVKEQPLPMDELMESVKASLPDSVSITGVTVFNDKHRTYQVNLSKPRRASVFIDQYSGKVTGKSERLGFFSTMFKLHRWLLDSANPHGEGMKTGKLLVGISTIIFVIVLISGVFIWWPRACANLKNSLVIPLGKGRKGFWKGLHVAGGMYALVFVLAMALTGLTYSFGWYRTAFYAICGVEQNPQKSFETSSASKGEGKRNHGGGQSLPEFGRWQLVYDELKAQNPDSPMITIGPETASVSLCPHGNGRASDKYEFNCCSGEITAIVKYADTDYADRLRGWIYSIHTGSLGGLITKIAWLLGALLGASLPVTGYYIWIRRLIKQRKNKLAQSK